MNGRLGGWALAVTAVTASRVPWSSSPREGASGRLSGGLADRAGRVVLDGGS